MIRVNWRVREAVSSDAEFIAENNIKMAEETEGRSLDPLTVMRGVGTLFSSPERGRYLIAESEEEPVGQCMITYEWSDWRCGDFWWIQSVYVLPAFRRRGVFSAIYQYISHEAARSEEVAGIRLYVERENRPAQETYSRLGLNPAPYAMFETDLSLK